MSMQYHNMDFSHSKNKSATIPYSRTCYPAGLWKHSRQANSEKRKRQKLGQMPEDKLHFQYTMHTVSSIPNRFPERNCLNRHPAFSQILHARTHSHTGSLSKSRRRHLSFQKRNFESVSQGTLLKNL